MSPPRVLRMVVTMPAALKIAAKALTLSGDERARLMQRFTRENLAEQQRLGIAIPQVLTPRQADAIATRAMQASKPEDSANLIGGLQAEYGEFFPRVFDQLVKDGKIAGELLIIPNLPSQTAKPTTTPHAHCQFTRCCFFLCFVFLMTSPSCSCNP